MGIPTLHPTPYTLNPTAYSLTLHPTTSTLHPTPYTIHHTPCALHATLPHLPLNPTPSLQREMGDESARKPAPEAAAASALLASVVTGADIELEEAEMNGEELRQVTRSSRSGSGLSQARG